MVLGEGRGVLGVVGIVDGYEKEWILEASRLWTGEGLKCKGRENSCGWGEMLGKPVWVE